MSTGAPTRPRKTHVDSPYLCPCFKITEQRLAEIAAEAGSTDFDHLRRYYQVGSRCTSCEIDARDLLYELSQGRGQDAAQGRVPLAARARRAATALKGEARFRARQALGWPRRFALFVARDEGYASELVLSNLRFPDDEKNANGPRVRFETEIRDTDGTRIGPVKRWTLPSGHSRAYPLEKLAPELPERFAGTLFLRFYGLRETGSLRPYCRLRHHATADGFQGSTHYHDQFLTRPHYQHVIVTHPVVRDQRCWVALSNPIDEPYRSALHLRVGDRQWTHAVSIPGRGALWEPVDALFPEAPTDAEDAFLWLESEDTIMAWFFWHRPDADVWVAQHK